jgi:hypothetical protein
MKIYHGLTLIILFVLSSCSKNPEALLKKAQERCQSIQNGTYEMTREVKYMTGREIVSSNFICSFKKLESDTFFNSVFHYTQYLKDADLGDSTYRRDVIYSGEFLLTSSYADNTAELISKTNYPDRIKAMTRNYFFYQPFTSKNGDPLIRNSDNKSKIKYKYIGEERINEQDCYHLKVEETPLNTNAQYLQSTRTEYNYWLRKDDYTPIQYSMQNDYLMNNKSLVEYDKYVLTKFEINNLKDESFIELSSIPANIKVKEYGNTK